MEKIEETFFKIYIESRLEESKSSLLMAISEFNELKNNAPNAAKIAKSTSGNYDTFIRDFECNLVYLLDCIETEEVLGSDENRSNYYTTMIDSAKKTFEANNIEGLNILGDKLPDNFTSGYYSTYGKDIQMEYAKIGKSPKFSIPA